MYLLEIKPEIPFQNYDLVKISLESDKYISKYIVRNKGGFIEF